MLETVLAACLGDYTHLGFTLSEIDDHTLELRFMGKHVGYFVSTGATEAGVKEACQVYLRGHELLSFKVWLPGSYSTLWRRIWLPPTYSLHSLANCILDAFDFDHDHLYSFHFSEKPYRSYNGAWRREGVKFVHPEAAKPHPIFGYKVAPGQEERPMRADKMILGQLQLIAGRRFIFLYDFGDEWHFQVKYEGSNDHVTRARYLHTGRGEAPEQYKYEEEE